MQLEIKITGRRLINALLFILLCVSFASLIYNFASAQQTQKDVSVSIILPSAVNASNYTKFIRVTNNDDVPGENDNLSVLVKISLVQKKEENNSSENKFLEWNATKTINSYSESGFGTLILENNSEYVLCAEIIALNFADLNPENNFICANITTKIFLDESINNSEYNETINIDETTEINETELNESVNETEEYDSTQNESNRCGCSLEIKTNKEIFSDGEKIEFQIIDCENSSKYNYPVEYWVEDNDKIVKQVINTTSKTQKTYTPSIDDSEKYFLIKTKISGCENTTQKLVVFVKESSITEPFMQISSPEEISADSGQEIIYVNLEGYKGNSAKTLISVWLENDGDKASSITKIYVNEKNTHFNFKIPIFIDVEKSGTYSIVAEGLDEKEHQNIKIILQKDEEIETKSTGTKFSEDLLNEGEIISFYTRKKIFEENITIYVSVDYPQNKTLVIRGESQTVILENISEKNTINMTIGSENETIFAELHSKNKIIDRAELKLNLTGKYENTEEEKKEFSSSTSPEISQKNSMNELVLYSYLNQTANQTINTTQSDKKNTNEITGEIIAVKPSGKNFAFAFAAIVICFVLFNKKSRGWILKKIKILKLRFFNKKQNS